MLNYQLVMVETHKGAFFELNDICTKKFPEVFVCVVTVLVFHFFSLARPHPALGVYLVFVGYLLCKKVRLRNFTPAAVFFYYRFFVHAHF